MQRLILAKPSEHDGRELPEQIPIEHNKINPFAGWGQGVRSLDHRDLKQIINKYRKLAWFSYSMYSNMKYQIIRNDSNWQFLSKDYIELTFVDDFSPTSKKLVAPIEERFFFIL